MGCDVHPIPEGQEPSEELMTPENILTKEDDLKEGMRLMVLTLVGCSLGLVTKEKDGSLTCRSPSGGTSHFLNFVNDRPPLEDGTPAPPRWVCMGSGNVAGLSKLEVYR